MIRLNDILEKVSAYHADADLDLIKKAYVYSAKVHQGQIRKSGEPYLVHPLEVAGLLADLKLDEASIVSGQDGNTGYFGNSMYHHGIATLALAEAYGAVDDRHVWPGGKKPRSIGAALELAVRAALGASRLRLGRQLVTEACGFCMMGGGLGILVAFWGVQVLLAMAPPELPTGPTHTSWGQR